MATKNDYRQYLKQTFGGLIDRLDLSELRKDFLKNRWLDQVMWLEGRAAKERNRHNTLRMITIVGGVIVPALIGFQKGNQKWQEIIGWSAFGLSQAVAVSAAVEEFFAHGEKYRNYRNTAESLKIEGWQFLQMAGPYHQFEDHADAYTTFAQRVEQYIQHDVQGFVSQLAERQEDSKKDKEKATQNAELALEKLNEQLQLQAQYEAQRRELEVEKQRVEAERQQLEQERERAAQSQKEEEKPAAQEAEGDTNQAAEVAPEKLPDLKAIAINWNEYQDDHDSTSVNGDTVQYLSANEILARVKTNPLGATNTAAEKTTEAAMSSNSSTLTPRLRSVLTKVPMCGVELIKQFEGCHLKAYPDPLTGGDPITIGWGTTRKRDGSPWRLGESISQQEADELLIHQIETSFLPDLAKIPCWSELNPNQQGAILSFAYNLGSKFYGAPNFNSITTVLKNRDWSKISEALIKYRNPGSNVEQGLLRRRKAEAELFLTPYA